MERGWFDKPVPVVLHESGGTIDYVSNRSIQPEDVESERVIPVREQEDWHAKLAHASEW